MARPTKEGMDYFPHDTDAANDEKIEGMRAMFGNDGYAFYFILLERIYRSNKAELCVKKPVIMASVISKLGLTQERFDEIIEAALDLELFDRTEYEESKIITSNGIRKRFSDVEKMREKWRQKKVSNNDVIPEDNPEDNERDNPQDNGQKTGERKVNKSKSNKNIYIVDSEYLWGLYPVKDGKQSAMKKLPKLIEQYGVEQLERAINRYLKSVEERRAKGFSDLRYKNGSTFFNGGYADYLDENYPEEQQFKPLTPVIKKMEG